MAKYDEKIPGAVNALIDDCARRTYDVRAQWNENMSMFREGTKAPPGVKKPWQTEFSINRISASVRTSLGRLVNVLVNTPDWYTIEAANPHNSQAEILAPIVRKLLDYYLDQAKFKRHASTFFMCSLISQGGLYIGWRKRMIQNPEYVIQQTAKGFEQEQRKIATKVANPQNQPELSPTELEDLLSQALDEFTAEAQGQTFAEPEVPPYIQIGGLDLRDIEAKHLYWDPNTPYMEDSAWKAMRYRVHKWELQLDADRGYFGKKALDALKPGNRPATWSQPEVSGSSSYPEDENLVEITVYFGPLIVDDKVVEERFFAVIANGETVLKSGTYPYWEPPGHNTPIIASSVRQIPFSATGEGIGDGANTLQKIYDTNNQLVCDSFRFAVSGINAVDFYKILDRTALDEGVYPGIVVETRGNPKDVFFRHDFATNIEAQARPVQNMLEGAIDQATGINELMLGGSNPYSRTSAAETNSRLNAGAEAVNTIALDLEQSFLIPALQKILARVLQFGLSEVTTNPDLAQLLSEEEQIELSRVSRADRLGAMALWFRFKIEGFSHSTDNDAELKRANELLAIANSGGPLASMINLAEFMKYYFRSMGIRDATRFLALTNNPMAIIGAENQALMSGHAVMISPADDHETHMQSHGPLAMGPDATPEMQQHYQDHQIAMRQMQQPQPGSV